MQSSTAVPVALCVRTERREQLTRLVEGALGWPVVDVDDAMLPPAALLADVAAVTARGAAQRTPTVLFVGDDDDPAAAAAAGASSVAVLAWPPTVDDLRTAVVGNATTDDRRPWCTVAASAGGVGATAVALAIAGIRAWRAGRTLAAVSGPPHVRGAPGVVGEQLASPAVWSAAAIVGGLPGLRVVSLQTPAVVGDVAPDTDTVVELGPIGERASLDAAPDVLVVRPDAAGVDATAATPARAVVVVGPGPVGLAELGRAAGSRALVPVRRDARVAAACHAGRHPTDAPGAWLRPFEEVVALLPSPPTS